MSGWEMKGKTPTMASTVEVTETLNQDLAESILTTTALVPACLAVVDQEDPAMEQFQSRF